MKSNFRILILSNPSCFQDEKRFISQILNLSSEIIFHFRRKVCSEQDEDMLKQLSECYPNRIVIHQSYEWVKKYPLKGIHLPKIEYTHYTQWRTEYPIISTSFHTLEEVQNNNYRFEYIFLSPIFSSISKKNYFPTLLHEEIKSFLYHYSQTPVIALGGCKPEHIPYLQDLGFQGVAFLGAVWEENIFSFIEKLKIYL